MEITRSISFHMGHRVPNHKSKCFNLHGHTYKVIIGVEGKVIETKGTSDEGMVIDFGDLKKILNEQVYEPLDHGFMMYIDDVMYPIFKDIKKEFKQKFIFTDFIPTAENIAKYIFDILNPLIEDKQLKLKYVTVWETLNSSATHSIK